MYFDGALRGPVSILVDKINKSSKIRIVFLNINNRVIMHSLTLSQGCSNNETEYETIIADLELALEIPIEDLIRLW